MECAECSTWNIPNWELLTRRRLMERGGRFAASCDTYESRLDKGSDAQASAQQQGVNLQHQSFLLMLFPSIFTTLMNE